MPPTTTEIPIGAYVEVTAGSGYVRFCGSTSFASGKWVGVELTEPKGKNNGSVGGVQYFECAPLHGVFVRPSQAKIANAPVAAIPRSVPARPTDRAPPSLPRTASMQSSPSPVGSSRAVSPSKPSVSTSPAIPTRIGPPSTPAKTSGLRPLGTSLATASRLLAPRRSSNRGSVDLTSASPFMSPPSNPSIIPPPPALVPIPSRAPPAIVVPPQPIEAPLIDPPRESEVPPSPSSTRAPSSPKAPTASPRTVTSQITSQSDDSQELRAKLRVLEAKRAEDARRIRELENRLTEGEAFLSLRPKLQAKLQSLQTESLSYKRELADLKLEHEALEGRLVEQSEQLEMATLDKEMADERAEAAQVEAELEKEQRAQKEVELEVLKKDRVLGATGGGDPSAKTSLDYIQLEKQNERLKDALVRLRDLTHETETDQRHKIADLERELSATDDLQSQFEQTLSRLENAENQIDDLKSQLDDALGAEDMLVQLTERNLLMGEKMEEMRAAIEDLEALKELSDEIEETHVETEKALQEEIDEKDMRLLAHIRGIEALQDTVVDYENTISQFRDLVATLQSELDAARELSQTHQNESQTQASQAAAALTLNMKLQSTATKNQAKTIDLEIKRLDAAQAREMLSIVQPYLPQTYIDSDRDAVSCYMLFQRLSYKTDLINTLVGQSYNFPESLYGEVSDSSLVGVCEMRGLTAHVSTLCKRFAAVLRRCDGEFYLNIGKLFPEIAPMEKRIDMHIDTLRREEFRFLECGSDIQKMLGQFDHLAETYFSGFQFDLGECELDRILSVEHDLDYFVAAIGLTKNHLETVMNDEEVIVELEDLDFDSQLLGPMNDILEASRSAKAASRKISKRIEDLLRESAALREDAIPQLGSLAETVTKATDFGIQLAQRVGSYISDIRTAKYPFKLSAILATVRELSASAIGAKDTSSWASVRDVISSLTKDAVVFLPAAMEADRVVKITGEAPWVVRVAEIKASAAINLDAERKVTQLNEELQSLVRAIRARDQSLQEAGVKIEIMERRNETVKKHADTIAELESDLSKARKQERAYEEAMEQLQADLDSLEQDYARLKASAASAPERPAHGVQPSEGIEPPQIEGSLETTHLLEQIESLRGAVKFLRSENSYLKGQDLLKELNSLVPLPELDPSSVDSSEASSEADSDEFPSSFSRPPPSLRSLSTATKKRGGWIPQKKTPQHQLSERAAEAEKLKERLRGLSERTASASLSRKGRGALRTP